MYTVYEASSWWCIIRTEMHSWYTRDQSQCRGWQKSRHRDGKFGMRKICSNLHRLRNQHLQRCRLLAREKAAPWEHSPLLHQNDGSKTTARSHLEELLSMSFRGKRASKADYAWHASSRSSDWWESQYHRHLSANKRHVHRCVKLLPLYPLNRELTWK